MTTETFISVDIEADGPIPGDYSMLSMGACVVGAPEKQFYVEFKPISDNFVPEALAVSGLDRDHLKRFGRTADMAMRDLEIWLSRVCEGNQPIFVGSNAPFDWMFICWYFWHFLGRNPFGHTALDVRSYAMGALNVSWSESSLKQIPQPLRLAELEHNALGDALAQGDCFRRVRAWRGDLLARVYDTARPRDVLDMD